MSNIEVFNILDLKRECLECEEVEEIINNINNFILEVNINNFEEVIKKYEYEVEDFWGGYIGFLKEKYYNKLVEVGFFNKFKF